MKFKKIRIFLSKALSIAVVIMLVGSSAFRYPVLAQEVPPTDTSAPIQTTIDSTATTDTTTTAIANTGDNTAGVTPTPTIDPTTNIQTTPSETPTDTQIPSPAITTSNVAGAPDSQITPATDSPAEATASGLEITNNANAVSSVSAEANSGNNTVQPPGDNSQPNSQSAGNGSQQGASISTGNATSVTNVNTSVNTTQINSQVVYQTINLYVDQTGNIDLTMPSDLAKELVTQNPDQQVIDAAVASVANDASVTNTVTGSANTGGNSADGGNVTIHTGDAISLLSILNRINFVMIDSVLHVVTINIFGTLNGNILLPDLPTATPTPCAECGSLTATNSATVTNTVHATADTGNNTVTANTGSITTGNAITNVKIINLINTVLYGTSQFQLYILDHGLWNGSFLGWANADGSTNTNSLVDPTAAPCQTCIAGAVIQNNANVTNTVNAFATTGNNSINGDSGAIETGNAYSSAAILNFVNTSLIRSFGFFGFINVLGSWTGDIGSKSLFPTPTPVTSQAIAENTSGGPVREKGGQLTMTHTNNVGDYVNPGDTVTFFITLHNPGNGRIFDTDLVLHLFKDGVDVGGTTINVGNIKIGGTVKVTTGLMLSPKAPGGPYTAHAVATGHVGEGSDTVSASADSMFTISGLWASPGDTGNPVTVIVDGFAPPNVQVLGATTTAKDNTNTLPALLVLLLLIPEYIFLRAARNRGLLSFVFTHNINWQARLQAMQTLLL